VPPWVCFAQELENNELNIYMDMVWSHQSFRYVKYSDKTGLAKSLSRAQVASFPPAQGSRHPTSSEHRLTLLSWEIADGFRSW
jgi:hypothetical protein